MAQQLKAEYHHIIVDEGGSVDHEDDPGGRTVCGITVATAKKLKMERQFEELFNEVPRGAIKVGDLTERQQILINTFYDKYFDKTTFSWMNEYTYDQIPPHIREYLQYLIVQFAPRTAARVLQRAINYATTSVAGGIHVDGVVGDITIQWLLRVANQDNFPRSLIAATFGAYVDICAKSPKKEASFYKGWCNRLLKWRKRYGSYYICS